MKKLIPFAALCGFFLAVAGGCEEKKKDAPKPSGDKPAATTPEKKG